MYLLGINKVHKCPFGKGSAPVTVLYLYCLVCVNTIMPINDFKCNIWMTYCICQCACAVNKQSTHMYRCITNSVPHTVFKKSKQLQTYWNILLVSPALKHTSWTLIRIHFSAETLLPLRYWLDNQIVPPPGNDWQEVKQTDQCSESIRVSLFRHQTTNDWLTVNTLHSHSNTIIINRTYLYVS